MCVHDAYNKNLKKRTFNNEMDSICSHFFFAYNLKCMFYYFTVGIYVVKSQKWRRYLLLTIHFHGWVLKQ